MNAKTSYIRLFNSFGISWSAHRFYQGFARRMVIELMTSALLLLMGAAPYCRAESLYISPQGKDSWSGKLPAPNQAGTDGPFATLEKARVAIRQQKKRGEHAPSGITVWLRGGTYTRQDSFSLGPEDAGTADEPIIYRGYKGEEARIVGGIRLPKGRPIQDEAVLRRLDPRIRANVMQFDLKGLGILDYGTISRSGDEPEGIELFSENRPMTLARWPNEGWLQTVDAPEGRKGARFTYSGDRPKHWAPANDIYVHGYWSEEWADSFERIQDINTATHTITTYPPHGVYGYAPNKRFYFLNVLEELDTPGEWYLDRQKGLLYFWPPDNLKDKPFYVSAVKKHVVVVNNAPYVSFRGLTIMVGRSSGIYVRGGHDNLVAGCKFLNLGQYGVFMHAGAKDSGVVSCDITQTGEGGIFLDGGDRKTLTAGKLYAINNDIYDYARNHRTYKPGVFCSGVGNRVANNRIHDAPHNAILISGNENLIEYNETYRVCQETSDAGAFYMGLDVTKRGNLLRYNYFHDITGRLVSCIYLDDFMSGTIIIGNYFKDVAIGILLGGGRDNLIRNNLFINSRPAIRPDARGKTTAKFQFANREGILFKRLKELGDSRTLYNQRYPQLSTFPDNDPAIPLGNRIEQNISMGGSWLEFHDEAITRKVLDVHDNIVDQDPGFVDYRGGNYHLTPNSLALRQNIKPIPFEKIGLFTDEYRKTVN